MALRPEYTKESSELPPSSPVNLQYHNSALVVHCISVIHKPVVVLITSSPQQSTSSSSTPVQRSVCVCVCADAAYMYTGISGE